MPERKHAIRFCVGLPDGPRSAVWRLWATRNDVYVAFRTLGGIVKASLHESGKWHMALTTDYVQRPDAILIGNNRFFEKWERPPEHQPGLTKAMRLVVPSTAVDIPPGVQGEPGPEQTRLIPPPPEGWFTAIYVVFTNERMAELWPGRSEGTNPIGKLRLPNGECVWLVALDFEKLNLTQNPADLHRQVQAAKERSAREHSIDWTSGPYPRTFFYGFEDHGVRFLMDLSMARAGTS